MCKMGTINAPFIIFNNILGGSCVRYPIRNNSNSANKVFVYVCGDLVVLPFDVVRARVHPSVTTYNSPERAFYNLQQLVGR